MAKITIGDLLVRLAAETSGIGEFQNTLHDITTSLSASQREIRTFQQDLDNLGLKAAQNAGRVEGLNSALNSFGSIAQRQLFHAAISEIVSLVEEMTNAFKAGENEITRATGAIGSRLEAFDANLKSLSSSSVQSIDQVGVAMGKLGASLHLDASDDLNRITKQILDLSQVTGETVTKLATNIPKLLDAFKIPVGQEATEAIQHLLDVSQRTGTSLAELSTDLQKFGPAFRTLGVDFGTAVEIVGKLNDAGVNVQQTLGNMTLAMRFLAQHGATDLKDALAVLFERIKQAPTDGQAFAIGAATMGRASKDLVDAIREGKLSIEDFTTAAIKTGTPLAEQAKAMETLAQKFQEFKNEVTAAVGTTIFKEISADIDAASNLLKATVTTWNEVSTAITNANTLMGAFFGISLKGFGDLLSYMQSFGPSLLGPLGPVLQAAAAMINGRTAGGAAGAGAPGTTAPDFYLGGGKISTETPSADFYLGGGKISTTKPTGSTSHRTDSIAAVQALLDKLNPQGGSGAGGYEDPEYKQLSQIVRILRERVEGGKNSLAALTVEIGYLMDAMLNNPDIVKLNEDLAKVQKAIATKQNLGLPVGDALYSQQTALLNQKALGGLDQQSSQKLLGLPDPAEVRANAEQVAAAFKYIEQQGTNSAGYLALAWSAAQTKILADMRKVGDAVTATQVLTADWAKTLADVQTMDFGTARTVLGLTTESQAFQQLIVEGRAYAEVVDAYQKGAASFNDVQNATIDLLEKNRTALNSVGKAFSDLDQVTLDYMETQKAMRSLNTEGALRMFGVSSEQDLQNALDKIEDAYAKVHKAATEAAAQNASSAALGGAIGAGNLANVGATPTTSVTAVGDLIAQFARAQDRMQEFRRAGKDITDAMVTDFENLSLKVQASTNDLGKAIQQLSVVTAASGAGALALLTDDLDRIKEKFGAASNEFLTGTAVAGEKATQLLVKMGVAVPSALTNAQTDLNASLKATTDTINQAYANLGVQGIAQGNARLTELYGNLQKIEADERSNAFVNMQAEVSYASQYYKTKIQLGEDFDHKDKVLNDLMVQRIRLTTNDATHYWTTFFNTIDQSWNAFTSGLSTEIAGIINGTSQVIDGFNKWESAFIRIGQSIENVVLNQIIKNLVLTSGLLNSLETGFLKLLGASPEVIGKLVPSVTGGAASAAALQAQINAAGIAFAAQVEAAGVAFSTGLLAGVTAATAEEEAAALALSVEMDAAGAEVAALMDGAGLGLATEIDGAGAALAVAMDGSGAALAAALDGSGAALAAEIDGAGGAFAAEVDAAGAALAAEIDGAGAAAAAELVAGGGAAAGEQAAGGLVGAVGGIAGAVGGIGKTIVSGLSSSIMGGISAITGIASGIVSGVQQAHANNLLDLIEKSTRFTWIATGEASDSISKTNIIISQKTTAMLDYMNNDLRQYLQNMNIDLDTIAGHTQIINLTAAFDFTPVTNLLTAIENTLIGIQYAIEDIGQRGGTSTFVAGHGSMETESASRGGTIGRKGGTSKDSASTVGDYTIIGAKQNTPDLSGLAYLETIVKQFNNLNGDWTNSQNNAWKPASLAGGGNVQNGLTDFTQVARFLSTQNESLTQFLDSLGITLGALNESAGSHLSQSDFNDVIPIVIQSGLLAAIRAQGTPLGNEEHTQWSAEQINAIQASVMTDFRDWFQNQFIPNINSFQGQNFGDILSTPRYGNAADTASIQAAIQAMLTAQATGTAPAGGGPSGGPVTYSNGTATIGSDYTGGLMALQQTFSNISAASTRTADNTGYMGGLASLKLGVDDAPLRKLTSKDLTNLALPPAILAAAAPLGGLLPYSNQRSGTANTFDDELGSRSLTVNITGAQFPVGMSPQEVAEALVTIMRTQTSLLR